MTSRAEVAVIIPYREDHGGWRDRDLAHVQSLWANTYPDWPQVIGRLSMDELWCKSRAIAVALEYTSAGVLILADADVWCSAGVGDSVLRVLEGQVTWSMPHGSVYRLDRDATAAVLATGEWPARPVLDQAPPYHGVPYRGMNGGGLVVIQRDLYERAPFDPRFKGWGHEDEAASIAWHVLGGRGHRGGARLWHLWHDQHPRSQAAVGSPESKALLKRYHAAGQDPASMEALIKEHRDALRL